MTFKGYKIEKAEKKNMLVYLKRYKTRNTCFNNPNPNVIENNILFFFSNKFIIMNRAGLHKKNKIINNCNIVSEVLNNV